MGTQSLPYDTRRYAIALVLDDYHIPKALRTQIFKVFGPKAHIIWGFWAVLSRRVSVCWVVVCLVCRFLFHLEKALWRLGSVHANGCRRQLAV